MRHSFIGAIRVRFISTSRRHAGIRLHTNRLYPDEITVRDGLPLTTVERTIADLISSRLADELIRQAVQEGLRSGILTRKDLITQADRRKGRVAKAIRSILEKEAGST